jgi:hypothetical protein
VSGTHARTLRLLTVGRGEEMAHVGGPSLRGRRLVVVSALLAAGLAVGGCSSSGADHSSSGNGASAPSKASGSAAWADCGAVPASRVKAALGVDVSAPTLDKAGNAVMCQYPGGGNPMSVIIRVETNSTLEEMQGLRKFGDSKAGVKSQDVSGLGDAAYTTSVSAPGVPTVTTVAAQKGQLNVQVTAAAPLPAIKTLVAQLIS